jgi:hypothetical protein
MSVGIENIALIVRAAPDEPRSRENRRLFVR